MSACINHPETPAEAACVLCNQPICGACSEVVAGHALCPTCLQAAQSSVAAPAPAVPASAAGAGAETAGATLPSGTGDPASEAPTVVPEVGSAGYLRALAAGALAAVACAVVWDKFVYYTHIQLGLIAVFLGVGVGIAVRAAAGGRGPLLPWIGAVLAGFSILLGYVLLGHDAAMENADVAARLGELPVFLRLPIIAAVVIPRLDPMDWVFVAIGVYEGWTIPRRS